MTNSPQENHDQVLETAQRWQKEGKKVAVATVVSTWGSAPRPAGSQLAVDETGKFVGSVSGGCIEGAVVTEALNILQNGGTKLLEYGVTNDKAWEVGLACGGNIKVFVEPVA